jgi:hypothetical protein
MHHGKVSAQLHLTPHSPPQQQQQHRGSNTNVGSISTTSRVREVALARQQHDYDADRSDATWLLS